MPEYQSTMRQAEPILCRSCDPLRQSNAEGDRHEARSAADLKVLHVVLSLDVGGLERNVVNQIRLAARLGQRADVLCLERPGLLAPQVEAAGGEVICLRKSPGLRLGMILRLRKLFASCRPDVVHTHQIAGLFYAGAAAKLAGVPLVVHTEHGSEPYSGRWRTRMLGRIAGSFAQTFFCLTEAMAEAVRSSGIMPSRKIRVIFNGIDTKQFLTPPNEEPVRKALGIPADAPVIGTVGRLVKVKRQDVLIRAFALLKRQFEAARLLVVGDGPLRQELAEVADSLGVRDWVHFVGYQSSSAPYIRAMNVFALTSESEGMPQAAIEACVSGVPVLASRVGGLPELIEDGRTGLLCEVGDEAGFAKAMEKLLCDPADARRMADAARTCAIRQFDIGRMAEEYHLHYMKSLHPVDALRPVQCFSTLSDRN